jgi:enoyl-CoA hydratase/carnithine racemase
MTLVRREDRGQRVAGLVLDRPEKLNAISREMIADLVAAVDECVRDPEVGVIVIRGEGRAFAAGADASPSGAMRDRSANTNREELLDELWARPTGT